MDVSNRWFCTDFRNLFVLIWFSAHAIYVISKFALSRGYNNIVGHVLCMGRGAVEKIQQQLLPHFENKLSNYIWSHVFLTTRLNPCSTEPVVNRWHCCHPDSRNSLEHIVPLEIKGCICHIVKWQIHPFISYDYYTSAVCLDSALAQSIWTIICNQQKLPLCFVCLAASYEWFILWTDVEWQADRPTISGKAWSGTSWSALNLLTLSASQICLKKLTGVWLIQDQRSPDASRACYGVSRQLMDGEIRSGSSTSSGPNIVITIINWPARRLIRVHISEWGFQRGNVS